jgi:hypothetical protein
MIPFITSRVNYSAITEADNKSDRDRQAELKNSDEKRRRMKVILNENSMLRFGNLKKNIADHDNSLLNTIKDSLLKIDPSLEKNSQPKALDEKFSRINSLDSELDYSKKTQLHSLSESEKNQKNDNSQNLNLSYVLSKDEDIFENKLSSLELEWHDLLDKNEKLITNKNSKPTDDVHIFINQRVSDELPLISEPSQFDKKFFNIDLRSSRSSELTNIEKNSLDNSHLVKSLAVDDKLGELDAIPMFFVADEVSLTEATKLKSLNNDLEKIFIDIKSKKSSDQLLLNIQNIEKCLKSDVDNTENFSQMDVSDLSYQLDFLEGYLQSEAYSKDMHNKLIDSLNNSRSYLIQIESSKLLDKESKSSAIENNLQINENTIAMMSPQVINSASISNKAVADNAINKNNQINGTSRIQQKNKDETLPLIVVRSV